MVHDVNWSQDFAKILRIFFADENVDKQTGRRIRNGLCAYMCVRMHTHGILIVIDLDVVCAVIGD